MKLIRAWFWSGVPENENWAQTLVRVAGNFLRLAITATAVIVALIAASNFAEERKAAQLDRQVRKVSVTVAASGPASGCSAPFPVAVTVRNDAPETLMSMEIALSARVPGTSTNVLGYDSNRLSWSHIVPPGHVLRRCVRLGRAVVRPFWVFAAEPLSYSVEFRSTEAWMLSETRAVRSAISDVR